MNRKYSPEMRERALRMLAETRPSHPTMMSAVRHVAGLLGMSPETLRLWQRRAEVDAGVKPGLTTDAAAEIKRLQKEVSELRKANEILKAASIFFAKGARPPLDEMIRFITEHRDRFGVELICQVLRPAVRGFLTSRGYRAAVTRAPSARQMRDDLLVSEITRLHAENYGVYGRRKMHALMRRQGWEIGRDQTERLMRVAGVCGVRKSKRVFTTRSDKTTVLPSDLVNRRFTASAPRRLWVCDVTYVATWSGFAYVAFVTDVYSRRIVGWNVAATLRAEILPLQALDMAAWAAGGDLTGLTHHSDHGSNYMAMVYTDRIVELGAIPSTGTVGDSFDNAMAEAVNNLYKTELIRQRGPWRTVEQVELATLEWVWWWNNQRLHGELDMRTPAEVENAYYADLESANPAPAGQSSR
ncbi:IS3 family transposase [Microbacterium oxydans]|uniref:IS3 family transposase n=1 Tax=Microbacterium oxydans TaxID=82380 RepID=UPI0022B1093E|nr:IS3 family transposase [Microbacterium oxydans]MCZ4299970.1 IS3 family transposase [Microbacterium oxydans]MCZ4299983.1 IS3 family transposase [Microbacterium oxydans]